MGLMQCLFENLLEVLIKLLVLNIKDKLHIFTVDDSVTLTKLF